MKIAFVFFIAILCVALSAVPSFSATVNTSVVTTPSAPLLEQSSYRWYSNLDAITPTTALASQSVSTPVPAAGSVVRLRMGVSAYDGTNLASSSSPTFALQYSQSTSSGWTNLGTSTPWVFYDNTGVSDGQVISTTLLSGSDTGESYGESNPSAVLPNDILLGDQGEWDWVVRNASASQSSGWFFRMVYSSGTVLDAYAAYPALTAVSVSTTSSSGGGNPGYSLLPPVLTQTPPPFPPVPSEILYSCDFNGDNICGIIDLSIMLYHYGSEGASVARYDLNGNRVIDLPDVSILMYYWVYL